MRISRDGPDQLATAESRVSTFVMQYFEVAFQVLSLNCIVDFGLLLAVRGSLLPVGRAGPADDRRHKCGFCQSLKAYATIQAVNTTG